jgi:hypothetical protein
MLLCTTTVNKPIKPVMDTTHGRNREHHIDLALILPAQKMPLALSSLVCFHFAAPAKSALLILKAFSNSAVHSRGHEEARGWSHRGTARHSSRFLHWRTVGGMLPSVASESDRLPHARVREVSHGEHGVAGGAFASLRRRSASICRRRRHRLYTMSV